MKKVVVVFLMLLFYTSAFGAASSLVCTKHGDMELSCVFTAHSTAATFETVPLCAGICTTNSTPLNFSNYYLYHVAYYYGTTGVTDNTDLYLREHDGSTGKDVLHGAGENILDNATNNNFQPLVNSTATIMPLYGPLYVVISNNAVNSGTGTIIFRFIKQ